MHSRHGDEALLVTTRDPSLADLICSLLNEHPLDDELSAKLQTLRRRQLDAAKLPNANRNKLLGLLIVSPGMVILADGEQIATAWQYEIATEIVKLLRGDVATRIETFLRGASTPEDTAAVGLGSRA